MDHQNFEFEEKNDRKVDSIVKVFSVFEIKQTVSIDLLIVTIQKERCYPCLKLFSEEADVLGHYKFMLPQKCRRQINI